MKRVTEKIWSSDGGHRVPVLRATQGINSSHKGIVGGRYLHFTHTTKVGLTHACTRLDHHHSYQTSILIFHAKNYGELDLLALSNFPRLSDVKILWSFHDIKMTELSIILLWLQGKPQILWKICFIKSYLASFSKSFRSSWKSLHIITKLLLTINNAANRWLEGQEDSKR